MLCGFRERGTTPSLITFADTGGELPHTYAHVAEMDTVCRLWWGIGIETVKQLYEGEFEGLEQNCIRKKMLPSLAYGTKGCSQKYKVGPQTKRMLQFLDAQRIKECVKAIGYDAGESHRQVGRAQMDHSKGRVEIFWYPLVEWGWRRQECVEAIKRHGLTQPGKSSCFYCPAMKRGEILRLKDNHPELFARAVAMEDNAVTTRNMGLTGRSLRWSDIGRQDDAQAKLWDFLDQQDETDTPCGCYDG
jgi:hypothetical protein